MRVGITGISSTLGSCLIPKLIEDQNIEQIIGLDLKVLNRDNYNKIHFIKGDVRNLSHLRNAFKNIDVLIHLAFVVIGSIPDPKKIYDINVNGTKNVFNVAAELGIKKVIYSSSVAAYGKNISNSAFLTEKSPLLGQEMSSFYYPYTKALVEIFIEDFKEQHPEIKITIFRPHLIVGPHFLSYTDNFKFSFGQLKSNRKIYWKIGHKNSIGNLVQYTDEHDLISAMHFAVSHVFPGIYNIAGEPYEITNIMNELGKEEKYIPFWLVKGFLTLCGIFSKKARCNKKWIEFTNNELIMDCSKLLNSSYPDKLISSKNIMLNSISYLKKIEKSSYF
ncbi:NAD-dependent epimerase/dehydratase family protein [Promethearchaeum syntrophicum]|uniref:NAD-dependent epimerase/dehydratase family protein n=1 Tax=Promethearchaeum syntrophicum TaxID=2594042 RepID=A0A5B9DHM2_9ARCH|nr:NAD-dependent epimerase/dehydratase family protein [Candidatus Prometheoarchaeum syntrophicum]QEE18127.1 UDP-galactose-4-epimerase [Candidatus Prometheoarchaeum syntrophicum]